MNHIIKLILPGILMLFACGPSMVYDDSDARQCPPGSDFCDGKCIVFDTHPDHCGACGNVCPAGSNACVEGVCVCMSSDNTRWSKDPCDDPAVCDQTGLCLTPDPFGESCDEIENIYCDDGRKVCVEGYCTVPDCDNPEICNLIDDNCDGLTDRTEPGVRLSQACYSGDPSTLDVGICHGGVQECVAGTWAPCIGDQLPTSEDGLLACDGVDGDCNNCVDDSYDEFGNLQCGNPDPKKTDVVFIVDISGSMSGYISATTTSMTALVNDLSAASWIRWSLIEVARSELLIKLVQPLDVFSAFLTALGGISIEGGSEPTYDAVVDTATNAFTAPELGRDADAQMLIISFGDEKAQTIVGNTETDVCNAITSSGAILAVFTDPLFFEDWDECALLFPLSSDATAMTNDLNQLFEDTCISVSMMKSANANWAAKLTQARKLEMELLTRAKIASDDMSGEDWSNYYSLGHILPKGD